MTDMGESLDTLVHIERLASPFTAYDRVADLVSSRIGASGLSPLLEKDEEDEDWVGKRIQDPGQKMTTVKAFPLGALGGSMVSEGHRDVSPPKATRFATLGRVSTSGETGTSKRASKAPLGDRSDSLESSISMGIAPTGLCVGQLKMGMSPVFTAGRQQNVRGMLMKMERYFRLMCYVAATWIEVVAKRLTKVAEA